MQLFKIISKAARYDFTPLGKIVLNGGLIAYPTDTIYGLGCHPLHEQAVERLYDIKGREKKEPFIVLLDSVRQLKDWCPVLPGIALPFIKQWPAPLTLVLKVRTELPEFLTRGGNTLAFRVPDSFLCRRIIRACGGALISTSANFSGQDPLTKPQDISNQFKDHLDAMVITIPQEGVASTVVSIVDGKITLLRKGSFSEGKLERIFESVQSGKIT
jgi:L-threonylcarbamoyladenylate synthase